MSDNNNSSKKNQNIPKKYIDLLNSLILSLKINPLKELQELSNESIIYSLILEIEPNFEKIPYNNKVLIDNDSNFDTRYNNFISIFTAVVNYKNESRSKDKFTKETNFKNSILINELLLNNQEQLFKIAEMLCFLTIISSNKNYFIEKVNEIEDSQISNLYYSIIEKYITFKIDESISNVVQKTNIFGNQVQNVKTFNLKSDNYNKSIEDLGLRELPNLNDEKNIVNKNKAILLNDFNNIIKERDKNNYENLEEEKEKILMQIKIDNLTKELNEIEEKYKILEKEKITIEEKYNELKEINNNLVININQNHQLLEYKENKINLDENIPINNFQNELNEANKIIENLKNENISLNKKLEQLNIDKENLENQLEESNLNIQNKTTEYEKVKENHKVQENNFIEIISNEKSKNEKLKQDLEEQIKINQKINEEKEIMKLEIEKFKIELNNNQYKENQNNNVNENAKKNNINKNESELKNEIQKLKNNLVEKEEKIKKLEEINLEKEKDNGDDINFYKKSYEEQKIRVNEEHKLISESLYKLAIHFMTLKDDLQKRINSSNSDK